MSRYIDANDLVRAMTLQANRTVLGEIAPPQLSYSEMLEIIADAPTADVVEVVRCKDCIHSSYYGKICHYSVGRDVSPDHYCAYGERSENES